MSLVDNPAGLQLYVSTFASTHILSEQIAAKLVLHLWLKNITPRELAFQ